MWWVGRSSSSENSDEDYLEEEGTDAQCYSWINEAKEEEFHQFWLRNAPIKDTNEESTHSELKRLSTTHTTFSHHIRVISGLLEKIVEETADRVLREVEEIRTCVRSVQTTWWAKDPQQVQLFEQQQANHLQKLDFHSQSFKLLCAVSERTFYTDTLISTTSQFLDNLKQLYNWYINVTNIKNTS